MAVTPIQAGDLVVYRVAGGTSVATGNPATLANTGNAVVIDDYRLVSGTYTLSQSIVMPTTTSVVNGVTQYSLIDSGTAGSDGLLTVSEDGRYIALTGYSRPLGGTGSITGTAAATNPRTIGILTTATGAVDTSTALTNAADANNARSAVTSNGTDIWFAGGASGINYTTKGSTTGVSLNASVPTGNFRQVNIVNGQLYASTGSTVTNRAVNTIGTGLPTGAGQAVTILPGLPTAGATAQSPYGFFFADLNPSIAGNDVLYVADDGSSTSTGLSKYLFDGTNWLAAGHVGVSADSYRGLTGTVSNGIVSLFSTRKGGSGATGGGELVSITDNTGYNDGQGTNHTANDFTSLAPTVLITAATNSAFRGVVYIPAAPAARNLTWRGTQTSWNAATGWLNGATPVTFDSVTPDNGVFDATGVSQSTVTLSSATTLGTLTFSTSGYTIQSNTLTIKGVNGSGISATGGSATINSAIVLGGDQAWSVGTNRTLTVNNLSGTAALSKNGAGLLVIGGAATHTNGTNVNGGEVRVNGSLAGNVIVNSSATLSGSGTISGTTVVNSGGTVSPGVSVGAITFSNGIDFQSGGTLNWNLNALSTANPGTNFSILNVTGGNFNAGGSSGLKLGFTGTSADPDTSNSAFWNAAHTWKIVDFSGAGTSTGVFSKLSNGSYQKGVFTQSITGDPNDVYVNFTPTNVAAAQTLIWNGVNASIAAGDNAGVWNAVDNNFVSGMTAAVFNPFSKDNVTFGSGTGGGSTTTVSVGGPLKVGNITFATGPNYILSGGSIGLNGNITVNTSATITSDIALQSASNWSVDAGQSLAVSGTLSGLANLTKSGPGQLTLTATGLSKNTYNGKITIQDGQLLINDELGARAALRGSPINLTSSTAEVFGSNNASATITEFRIGEVSGSGKVTSKFGAISQTLLINAQADATFSGILDVGDGTQELRIRGTGTQTLSGLTATQSPKTLHIYHGAGFTLAGTAEFNNGINGNNVQIDGGTLTLDNSTTNDPDRLAAVVSTISGRGRLNYIGNSAGSTEGLGTLAVSNNGAMHVAVTHTAGTTANTDVTFAIVTHSGSGTLNFENTGGVLGATGNNPHIFITSGVPDVSTATTTTNLALVNGIIGRKGAVGGPNPVGYAFVNGTDYATYDATLGVQAYNAYHVGLTGAVATDNVSITTTDTVAATQAINSLKLAPTTAGQTLTVASGAALNTLSVLTTGSADMTITGAGTVLANGSTRQLYVQSGRTLTVNAAISNFQTSAGDSPIAKSGGGTLVLGGTQTFTETLRITEGVVRAQPGVSLAGTVSGSNTTSTATIDIRDAVLEIAGPSTETTTIFALGNVTNTFQFNGSGGFAAFGGPRKVDLGGQIGWEAPNMVGAGNALVFGSATATDRIELVNSINLNPVNFDDTYNLREFRVDKNVTPNSGDFARLSGNISGSVYNDIFKTGNGSLELTADNRTSGGGFNGGINVAQGTLLAGATGALGNAMYTIVGGRGGSSDAALLTSAAITIDKDIHVQSGSSGTASLGGNAAVNSTFSGAINLNRNVQVTQVAGGKTTFSGLISDFSGSNKVTKVGAGTVEFSNPTGNTYTGGTDITAGMLVVNNTSGSGTGTGTVTISGTGMLGGSGFISGAVVINNGGTLSPGNSPGTLTLGNNLTLNAGSISNFEIQNSTTYDKVGGVNNLTFGGTVNVTNYLTGQNYAIGQVYDLFDWTGTGSGTFSTLSLPTLSTGLQWKSFNGAQFDYTTGQIVVEAAPANVPAGSGTWANGSGNGVWATNTSPNNSWSTGYPSLPTHIATFDGTGIANTSGPNIGTRIVDLTNGVIVNKTIGGLLLSGNNYTIGLAATANTLTMDNGASAAAITASSGTQIINAKVITSATSDLNITAQTGGALSLVGGITNALNKTVTLTQSGAGTLMTGDIKNGSGTGGSIAAGNFGIAAGSTVTVNGNIDDTLVVNPLTSTTFSGTTIIGNNALVTANRILQNILTINGTVGQPNAKVTIKASSPNTDNTGVPPNNKAGDDNQISKLATLNIANNAGTIYPTATPMMVYYGTLNLTNNDLLITGMSLNAVTDMVRSGYNLGDWAGTGITSSLANASPSLYALGIYDLGPIATTYHGTTTIAANTILVKFTYAGDTNGDGIINLDDYQAVDVNINTAVSGYQNGDTNYDGVVNLDDYQVIDVNIVNGTATTIPLPEPSSFVLGFLGLLGLLLARHKRGQKS